MKKQSCIFLSFLQILSVTLFCACAVTTAVSDEPNVWTEVPSDAVGFGVEGAVCQCGDAFFTLQSIETDGNNLLISYYFQNNGKDELCFDDLFSLTVGQGPSKITWIYDSPLDNRTFKRLKKGESNVQRVVYSPLNYGYPVELHLSGRDKPADFTTVFYNPNTGVLGSMEDADVWFCSECREFLITDYCTNCGARNPKLSRMNADGSWWCSNCKEFRTTKFCTICGEQMPEE